MVEPLTRNFAFMLAGLTMLYLIIDALGAAKLSIFVLYLTLGLATRYPKVAITDPFLLTDCAEVFMCLVALHLGFIWAVPFAFMVIWMALIPGVRIETPVDSLIRMPSIYIALVGFYIATTFFGVSAVGGISLAIFISAFLWSSIAWFGLSVTQPAFFAVALAKPVIFYRFLPWIGCCWV